MESSADLRRTFDAALLALGRLDGISAFLPDPDVFLYTYVRKEAVLSSQIEGTQSSLSDLLRMELDEAPGVPLDDAVEVSNYVAAIEHGLARLREGFPLSNRLLRETHEILLRSGRGAAKQPGAFRRSQNWIGGTRPGNAAFVPPPPERVEELMAALERFLHGQPVDVPPLLKAGLAHVQFETIHPFLDGNGRVGRLLIALILATEGVLREPLLYLSLYFKQHRSAYYEHLSGVRDRGAWEEWLRFFAEGVRETAEGAVATARRLSELFARDSARVHAAGRSAGSAARILAAFRERPLWTIARLKAATGLPVPTVTRAVAALEKLGIVRETTGRRRGRVFSYNASLKILSEGTEPL
ncbi:MAG: Fic family protein [Gammaproteobacteria bacterium]|nr:Fic family protein [Gammaproteobacteria bacterium]